MATLMTALLIAIPAPTVVAQGNGNGGKTSRFSALEIPIAGTPFRMNEPTLGPMTVIINGSDDGKGSAAYARIDKVNKHVDVYGFLPEPLFADENGIFVNGGNVVATDLSTEVSGNNWYLNYGQDVNNDGWISVRGRTRRRGRYEWRAVLLVPNQ